MNLVIWGAPASHPHQGDRDIQNAVGSLLINYAHLSYGLRIINELCLLKFLLSDGALNFCKGQSHSYILWVRNL